MKRLLVLALRLQSSLLPLAGPPIAARAQVTVLPDPGCASCRISVQRVLVFGDTAGPGELPPEIRSVRSDGRDRFLVAGYVPEPPLLYDGTGRFLARVGSKGEGPGEVRAPVLAALTADTAWILDGLNARVTAFAVAPEVRVVRSWRTPGMARVLAATRTVDGAIVANIFGSTRSDFGIPLMRLTPDGTRQPMGEIRTALTRAQARWLMRAIAPSRRGGVWAAHYDQYHIERFDSAGQVATALRREVPWFPQGDGTVPIPTPDAPPKPTTFAILEDEAGLLWVMTAVADPRYREGLRPRQRVHSSDQAAWAMADYDRYFDTMVDVIDPDTGRLVVSQRVDQSLMFALHPVRRGMLAGGIRILGSGHQLVVVYRLTLAQ